MCVNYSMNKDGKGGEKHGSAAERLIASQAKKHKVAVAQVPVIGEPAPGMHGAF